MKRLFFPLSCFFALHLILRYALDLRDLPGAAGTQTVYKASLGIRRGDISVACLQWLMHYLDVGPRMAAQILSSICGGLTVISAFLAGATHSSRSGTIAAWLIAVWPMTHYYALMTGSDPIALSTSWFAVSLCWWGCAQLPIGSLAIMIGVTLAMISVLIKEIALPNLLLLLFMPWCIRRWNILLLLALPICVYTAYWAYAWYWPDSPHRLGALAAPSLNDIQIVWKRLMDFYDRGIPQGKFDQLMIGAGLLSIGVKFRRFRHLLLWTLAAIILFGSVYMLGAKTRPRYLAPVGLALILSLSLPLSNIRYWKPLTLILCAMIFLDTWAFFSSWGTHRQKMVGGHPPRIPQAPSFWSHQYQHSSDLTLRDLSLYGAINMLEWMENSSGLATMRLRDERHRSVMAFAAIVGKPLVVLDPGACCAGQPVDQRCAQKTIDVLSQAGIALVLPTDIKGVERIYANEARWRALLMAHVELTAHQFWLHAPAKGSGGPLPCQSSIPFRNAK